MASSVLPWRSPSAPDFRRPPSAPFRYPLWLRKLKGKAGVYAVRDRRSKRVLYVGRGRTDLKKSIVRHFAAWNPRDWWTRSHHYWTVDRTKVEVKVWLVEGDVIAAEAKLIDRLMPKDNRRKERAALGTSASEEEVPF